MAQELKPRPDWERQLRRLMRRERLFAVVDACDLDVVPALAQAMGGERAVSIYKGLPNEEDWAIGAYLLRVDPPVLDWILRELPRESWGILIESDLSLQELLVHLQQYVTLLAPNGEEWFFRFYDPRVLPLYLETATADERLAFLQAMEEVGTVDEKGAVVWW